MWKKNCWLSGEFSSWKNCLFLIYKFNESSKVYQCKLYILIIHQPASASTLGGSWLRCFCLLSHVKVIKQHISWAYHKYLLIIIKAQMVWELGWRAGPHVNHRNKLILMVQPRFSYPSRIPVSAAVWRILSRQHFWRSVILQSYGRSKLDDWEDGDFYVLHT